MSLDQSKKKASVASSLFASMAGMFSKFVRPTGTAFRPSKNHRFKYSVNNSSGTKIRRAIRRGNFGVVNKLGVIGRAIAEEQREKWLLSKNKPVIQLSTHI